MSRFDEEKYTKIWGEPPPREQDLVGSGSNQDTSEQAGLVLEQDRVPSLMDHEIGSRLHRIEVSLGQILDRLTELESKVDMLSGEIARDPYESRRQRPY